MPHQAKKGGYVNANDHAITSLLVATEACEALAENGFHILSVMTGYRQPRIVIQSEPRADEIFNGAIKTRYFDHAARKSVTVKVASYKGAVVQWRSVS